MAGEGGRLYRLEELHGGKPIACPLEELGPGAGAGRQLLYDRLRPEAAQVEGLGMPEKEVVLGMMADLASDTVVVLAPRTRVKREVEDQMRAKNLEWECFKKKNEDWKERLSRQETKPKEAGEQEVTTASSTSKKRKGGKQMPKSSKKSKAAEQKRPPAVELPRSPRKEGSVLHPFFRVVKK